MQHIARDKLRRLATGYCAVVLGCTPAPSAAPAPEEPMDPIEARAFRAAVANFQELYAGRSILVDPRPIALTDRDFLFPRPTEYHDGRGALIAARLAILAELGVDTVRAGAEPGTWILRVMPIIYRPRVGREASVIDLVAGSRDGAWSVLERRLLVNFEK